jgi:hypothetical protein
LSDFQPVTSVQEENQQQTENDSTRFLPIVSSTDIESPPILPPKRIYGIIKNNCFRIKN